MRKRVPCIYSQYGMCRHPEHAAEKIECDGINRKCEIQKRIEEWGL